MTTLPASRRELRNFFSILSTQERNKWTELIAETIHEDWRKPRLLANGTYDPRPKVTEDAEWIARHNGQTTVDIANMAYPDLPEDRKYHNRTSAQVILEIILEAIEAEKDVQSQAFMEEAAIKIHVMWLPANQMAPDSQKLEYDALSHEDKEKDREVVRIGLRQLLGVEPKY